MHFATYKFQPEALIRAIRYKASQIPIYSNSYGPALDFAALSTILNDAFMEGIAEVSFSSFFLFNIKLINKGIVLCDNLLSIPLIHSLILIPWSFKSLVFQFTNIVFVL